jgi:DNA mismatch endonuclease (patch repair protein)
LAIFVHGCFWHSHSCRFNKTRPEQNSEVWRAKLDGNLERDKRNLNRLRELGWQALVVWECETKDRKSLRSLLASRMAELAPAGNSKVVTDAR